MQIITSGLIFGCIYGLTALGLVLIYKTSDIVNFAQGEMAMVTTFISYTFISQFEFGYIRSFILALIFAGLFGAFIYQVFLKRVQSAPPLNQIVLTLGLFMALNGSAGLIWGHKPASYPQAIQGDTIQIGSVFITPNEIFMISITLILMLVFFLLFRFTKIGLAMRACAQDIKASQLMGIKVTMIFTTAWGVGAILGGVSGMMAAPKTFLEINMMSDVMIMAFAGAVLGGFASLPGALFGGIFIGVFENLIGFYFSSELKLVYTFLLIILVLYVRPQGIFGGKQTLKKV